MERTTYSYLSPKCRVVEAPDKGGHAVRCVEAVPAGEVIAVWGGAIVGKAELAALPPQYREHTVQVEEGLFLASLVPDDAADYVNHSCDPNAGLSGQIVLVAMRAIAPGEEITFDYAMTDGEPYDEFACACGKPSCRNRVSGEDWRLPQLWERYAGYFSPYLQRRIDRLRAENA
jgi:uncharacterized protein